MGYREFTNMFGGNSVAIESGCDLDTVPTDLRELITDQYREVFENPEPYFKALAAKCDLEGLRRFHEKVASVDRLVLEVHRSQLVPGVNQSDVLFRLILPSSRFGFGFRLPLAEDLREMHWGFEHPVLKRLYSGIDGTVEGEIWCSSVLENSARVGFYIGDRELRNRDEFGFTSDSIDSFYRNDTGDYLFAFGDRAVWLRHEDDLLVDAGPIDEVVNSYFHCQLDGSHWLDGPY